MTKKLIEYLKLARNAKGKGEVTEALLGQLKNDYQNTGLHKSLGSHASTYLPYILRQSLSKWKDPFAKNRVLDTLRSAGGASVKQGLPVGALGSTLSYAASEEGDSNAEVLLPAAMLLAGGSRAAKSSLRSMRRGFDHGVARSRRLLQAGFLPSEKKYEAIAGLRGQGVASALATLKQNPGLIKEWWSKGNDGLRIGMLSNSQMSADRIKRVVGSAVRDWGVTDLDAGLVINPHIASGILSGAMTRQAKKLGFKRLSGTLSHGRVRKLEGAPIQGGDGVPYTAKDLANDYANEVAHNHRRRGFSNEDDIIPGGLLPWRQLPSEARAALKNFGIRGPADYEQFASNTHTQVDNVLGDFKRKDLIFGKADGSLQFPRLRSGGDLPLRGNNTVYFDPRAKAKEFDINLLQ